MGIIALSSLIVAGTGVFLASRILANMPPGNKRVQADIKALRDELQKSFGSLVGLQGKELELLASTEGKTRKVRGLRKVSFGSFRTIYEEPVVEYGQRKYVSSGNDALVVAKTTAHEYIFWKKKKGTRLVVDNHFVGHISEDGQLMGGPKEKDLLARIVNQPNGLDAIWVGDREVANLKPEHRKKNKDLQTRVFELVFHPLTPEEETLLWALTLYDLLLADADAA